MRKIVLDTNAYSQLMRGDEAVARALGEAGSVYLPIFVIAELLSGFKNGNREAENRAVLKQFEEIETVERFFPTQETIEIFGDIFSHLKKAGTPIPMHDIWIAAIAVETGSEVATYDRHFSSIPQVRVWRKL
jgi:tRNA(fMet)-specific endonuclease VapC